MNEERAGDRQVRRLSPASREDRPYAFSEFSEEANIVLLGDPGAGKTHLFRSFADKEGGRFLSVRNFLNVPAIAGNTVFLDALDEKRSGRGDDDIVDQIVRKLFANPPLKLRISCRERDWLGESDLAVFKPYFDEHGGAVVLSLQALTSDERRAIVTEQGTADADAFLREAERRGLAEFLMNPQNLIMLSEVVRAGDWPSNRAELFEASIRLLLREHNQEHARRGEGIYGPDELRENAGAICAIRLIADVAGITLNDQSKNPEYPSYRTISGIDPAKSQAALRRRIFTTAGVPDCVDYLHRTTAEYLAADWLAGHVRKGGSLGRVRALIGVDGHPASELRGLHAWLPVRLPEHAEIFIDADPYGVLTYGDPGSLTPSARQRLLRALSALSERDPWFRSGNWSSSHLGGLATADMVDAFKAILKSPQSNFSLRSIVIDALASGAPLPAMQGDLVTILLREDATYAERQGAVVALMNLGTNGNAAINDAYSKLGITEAGIRLRAVILSRLYAERRGPADVIDTLTLALACSSDIALGSLWPLRDSIPLADIPAILDGFNPSRPKAGGDDRRNFFEVARTLDHILFRLLKSQTEIPGHAVLKWLRARRNYGQSFGRGESVELAQLLKTRGDRTSAVIDALIDEITSETRAPLFVRRLFELTFRVVTNEDFAERLLSHLEGVKHDDPKEAILYELALSFSFDAVERGTFRFENLFAKADGRPELEAIRDRLMWVEIPDWQQQNNAERAEEQAKRQEDLDQVRRDFTKSEQAIQSGSDLGWLGYLARIYFANSADLDRGASPRERLDEILGEDNSGTAIEGFIAVLRRSDIPPVSEVIKTYAEGQTNEWWYAILAGMNEQWQRNQNIDDFDNNLLGTALALDLLYPTLGYEQQESAPNRATCKIAALKDRSEVARDTYVALVEDGLIRNVEYPNGLHELLSDERFSSFRRAVVFALLAAYPSASGLIQLMHCGCRLLGARNALLPIARNVLSGTQVSDQRKRDAWLIGAYFLSPDEFLITLRERVAADVGVVWTLRDLTGNARHGVQTEGLELHVSQLEEMARLVGQYFSNAGYPVGSSSGDRNPFNGAEFVRSLIDRISADPGQEASAALMRLEGETGLASYRDHIKHARANQLARRRDSEYRQPDWPQTVETLANGGPANVADLHASLVDHLVDLRARIASANNDIYKQFWNEDQWGRIETPKPEESCRDVLLGLLRDRLLPLSVIVEPEGHMVADKRADIAVSLPQRKILVELKRDYHAEVWTAAESQLDRFYTRDPDAAGFGVYGVFWFGEKRPGGATALPAPPAGATRPQSAANMEKMLRENLPSDKQARLAILVIDVSEPIR